MAFEEVRNAVGSMGEYVYMLSSVQKWFAFFFSERRMGPWYPSMAALCVQLSTMRVQYLRMNIMGEHPLDICNPHSKQRKTTQMVWLRG